MLNVLATSITRTATSISTATRGSILPHPALPTKCITIPSPQIQTACQKYCYSKGANSKNAAASVERMSNNISRLYARRVLELASMSAATMAITTKMESQTEMISKPSEWSTVDLVAQRREFGESISSLGKTKIERIWAAGVYCLFMCLAIFIIYIWPCLCVLTLVPFFVWIYLADFLSGFLGLTLTHMIFYHLFISFLLAYHLSPLLIFFKISLFHHHIRFIPQTLHLRKPHCQSSTPRIATSTPSPFGISYRARIQISRLCVGIRHLVHRKGRADVYQISSVGHDSKRSIPLTVYYQIFQTARWYTWTFLERNGENAWRIVRKELRRCTPIWRPQHKKNKT